MTGKVFLVGAGPGDPLLITQKGRLCLEHADVVLYDSLAHPSLLSYCSETCIRLDVGKRKGHHQKTQDEINALLVEYAQKGLAIVRLKGGDPLIFGRGGEEIEVLIKHHIPFEIVPGVTSAVAAPAYAGIPLTHRLLSRSVAFITGSLQKGEAYLDIPEADTLVFLMPVTHLTLICEKVVGLKKFHKDTPCALIHHATTAKQYTVVGTLATIEEKSKGMSSPAIFVVGDVVSFSDRFNWRVHQPLLSQRIVVLRSKDQSQSFIQRLSYYGADVIHFPLLQFEKNDEGFQVLTSDMLGAVDTLLFTSQNGVDFFFEALTKAKLDSRSLAQHHILSIGSKTTEALELRGLIPDQEATQSHTEGVADLINEATHVRSVLCPTSTLNNGVLASLCKKSIQILPLYRTLKPKHIDLTIEKDDWIIFTSPSSVNHFFEEYDGNTQSLTAFCIGPTTEKALSDKFDGTIIVSDIPSVEGVIDTIMRFQQTHAQI